MKISADYYEFLLEIGVRYEGEVEGVGEVYCELVTIASSTADNGFRRGGATFLSTAYVPMVIPYGEEHKEKGTDDIVITGANNSSLTVKTDAVDLHFNSDTDFKGKHTIADLTGLAIGYETYGEAKIGIGAGAYGQIPIQKVLFLGNQYAGYWYTYAGMEPGVSLQTAADYSVGAGKNWFIAFNRNFLANNPSGFAGFYTSVGATAGLKAIGGISINGNKVQSKDGAWDILSLGVSGSVGASVGLLGSGNVGASVGIGRTSLLNTNVIPTKNRSYADIVANWFVIFF